MHYLAQIKPLIMQNQFDHGRVVEYVFLNLRGLRRWGLDSFAWIKCSGGRSFMVMALPIKHASKFIKRLKGYLVCPPNALFKSNNYGFSLRLDSFPGFCLAE